MRESHESREQWARRHHCAQTDFEELAWIYCQDTDKLRAEVERMRIIISAALRALPVGYLPNHTADNLAAMCSALAKAHNDECVKGDSLQEEVERLRADANARAVEELRVQGEDYVRRAFGELDPGEFGHAKPEEPDWTVTLAAQAKNSYARTDEPVEESAARLLAMVVEGLCNLGREVRRGGKS